MALKMIDSRWSVSNDIGISSANDIKLSKNCKSLDGEASYAVIYFKRNSWASACIYVLIRVQYFSFILKIPASVSGI